MLALLVYFGLWLVACAIGVLTLRMIWRRSAAYPSARLRIALRTFWIAFAFTPTVAACGAVAVVPFPLLLAAELILPASDVCGPFVPPNLVAVGLVWLVAAALHVVVTRARRRRTAG